MVLLLNFSSSTNCCDGYSFCGSHICWVLSKLDLYCRVEPISGCSSDFEHSLVWTGPAGFMTTTIAQPVMGSTTNYTSAAVVVSIGSNESGNYSCTVNDGTVSSFYVDSVEYSAILLVWLIYSYNTIIVILNFGMLSFTVPEPTVSLHSDLSNPLLSGSSLTLTCTAELSLEVNVPLMSVSTTWKGLEWNYNYIICSSWNESLTLYKSLHAVSSLELRDSGDMHVRWNLEVELSWLQVLSSQLVIFMLTIRLGQSDSISIRLLLL